MTKTSDLETIREWISYDSSSGEFVFLKSPNRRKPIGSRAGTKDKNGYIQITILGKTHMGHRVAFLLHHGWIATTFIDHKDGDPSNNKIENLRPANRNQNGANAKISKRNTTGIKGVYFDKSLRKFVARIKTEGKQIFIGCYEQIADAKHAIEEARKNYHGEFARNQ